MQFVDEHMQRCKPQNTAEEQRHRLELPPRRVGRHAIGARPCDVDELK
jgi:hypothetical protein